MFFTAFPRFIGGGGWAFQVKLSGARYHRSAARLSDRLFEAGYACAPTTGLDTLCALSPLSRSSSDIPPAVAALAEVLAPTECAMSRQDEGSSAFALPVYISPRNGGEGELHEVGMQLSGIQSIEAAQLETPWLWASHAQWQTCLMLDLTVDQCTELRRRWCAGLRDYSKAEGDLK